MCKGPGQKEVWPSTKKPTSLSQREHRRQWPGGGLRSRQRPSRPKLWAEAECGGCWHQGVLFFMFIYFEGEREREKDTHTGACVHVERQREKNSKQASCCQRRAWRRTRSHEREIMTWAEIKSWTLNPLSHPGTPTLEGSKEESNQVWSVLLFFICTFF